jgi:hypothetical protein
MALEARLEQVCAKRRGDTFCEWRRFLSRGREAVQINDGILRAPARLLPDDALVRVRDQRKFIACRPLAGFQVRIDIVGQCWNRRSVDQRGWGGRIDDGPEHGKQGGQDGETAA